MHKTNKGMEELESCEEVSEAQRWRRKDLNLSEISVVGKHSLFGKKFYGQICRNANVKQKKKMC